MKTHETECNPHECWVLGIFLYAEKYACLYAGRLVLRSFSLISIAKVR